MAKRIKRAATAVLAALSLAVMLGACSGTGSSAEKVTINVFNWGEYIGETTIADFEKTYPNIKVNYENFTTNEDMYVKIKTGGSAYDVAIPSDYMIKRMLDEGLLNKIDMSGIPNYKYIDGRFKSLSYDPGNEYSVPYMWGTVGILYNKTMVSDPTDTWKILWNEKYKKQIIMPDSERDSIGVTLKMLGYSMNTKNIAELEEARKALIQQKPLVQAYVVDEVRDIMIGESAALAVVWSGDAYYCMSENENLAYSIPKEGTNYWFDSMVIPTTSKHKKEAEIFINFMCDPKIAFNNADYIGYATPNTEVMKLLDPALVADRNAYPLKEDLESSEIFEYPGDEVNKEYSRIWTEVKAD
ncbi:MAG TPA: ABC transporter substrate-binding protein [Clostridia bacterium]|nr:ABC transporter substrate-binding protein [Clostridia bacterium]